MLPGSPSRKQRTSLLALSTLSVILPDCRWHGFQSATSHEVRRDAGATPTSDAHLIDTVRISGSWGECRSKQRIFPFGFPSPTEAPPPLFEAWEPERGCAEARRHVREFANDPTALTVRDPTLLECNAAQRVGGMSELWLERSLDCNSSQAGWRYCGEYRRIVDFYDDFKLCMFRHLPQLSSEPSHWRIEWQTSAVGRVEHVVLFRTLESTRYQLFPEAIERLDPPECLATILQRCGGSRCSFVQNFRIRRLSNGYASN